MSWEFFESREVRAGKPHRCAECRGEIVIGERHTYCCGKIEGYFDSYRLCGVCGLIVSEGFRADLFCHDEGWPMGGLRSQLAEEHGIEDAHLWALERQSERATRSHAADAIAYAVLAFQGGA